MFNISIKHNPFQKIFYVEISGSDQNPFYHSETYGDETTAMEAFGKCRVFSDGAYQMQRFIHQSFVTSTDGSVLQFMARARKIDETNSTKKDYVELMNRAALSQAYSAIIGYCPFEDSPEIEESHIRKVLQETVGIHAEIVANEFAERLREICDESEIAEMKKGRCYPNDFFDSNEELSASFVSNCYDWTEYHDGHGAHDFALDVMNAALDGLSTVL